MQMGTSVQAGALMELETLVGWSSENGGGREPCKMKLVRLAGASTHSQARVGTPVGGRLSSGP